MLDKLKQQKQRLLDPESGGACESPSSTGSFKDDIVALCPSLSYQERLIGCLTCFVLGLVISLGSTFRIAKLVHGHPAPFAIAYTVGNLLSLGCTAFFVGPCKQVHTMFDAKRRVSASLYLVFIALTLVLCFSPDIPHRVGLVMLSVLSQFVALLWYSLSYIPYGRSIALSCCKRMCGLKPGDEV